MTGGHRFAAFLGVAMAPGAQFPAQLSKLVSEVLVDPEVDKAVEEPIATGKPQGHKFHPIRDSFPSYGVVQDGDHTWCPANVEDNDYWNQHSGGSISSSSL